MPSFMTGMKSFSLSTRLSHLRMWVTERAGEEKETEKIEEKAMQN